MSPNVIASGFRPLFLIFLLLANSALAESLSEQAGHFLTRPEVTGVLLVSGTVFWLLSMLTLGTGLAEVLCFTSFALLFGGRYLEGMSLWVPMGLFLAGALFAAAEIFLLPGFGAFGVLSLMSFAGLSVLLMESPLNGVGIFSLSILLATALGALTLKFLPRFVTTRKILILDAPGATERAVRAVSSVTVQVGEVGRVVTTLRPVGTVEFETGRLEVLSESAFLNKGERVEVVRIEGQKVVVRPCES